MTWSFETAARTLWQEARSETIDGQRAVAHVIVNRLHDGRWGKTLAAVCLSPLQFSGWNAHDPNRMETANLPDDDPKLGELRVILQHAVEGGDPDPTGGAKFYYAPRAVAEPPWAKDMISCGEFGTQLFFKEKAKT